MKRLFQVLTAFIFVLSLPSGAGTAAQPSNSIKVLNASIMRPDDATREKWYKEFMNAPRSYIDPVIRQRLLSAPTTLPVPLLLDHITYTPSERNQSSCGNCWVWAGTGLSETKHSVEQGVKDRLSIQYFDSAYYASTSPHYYACNGGNLNSFVNFYNSHVFVPWSNTNAYFQDQAGGSAPHVNVSSISVNPSYDGNPNSRLTGHDPYRWPNSGYGDCQYQEHTQPKEGGRV